ncbi:hypothetical protein E4U59_004834, partial [Claviceps monticola]
MSRPVARRLYNSLPSRPTPPWARLIGFTSLDLPHHHHHYHGRSMHSTSASRSKAASNPAMSFPCLDALETRSATLSRVSSDSGPEPSYTSGATENFRCKDPLLLDWGGTLPQFT